MQGGKNVERRKTWMEKEEEEGGRVSREWARGAEGWRVLVEIYDRR